MDLPIWRMSVDQYHQMLAAGILEDGDRIELLEGWLVEKMTKYPRHVLATRRTRIHLERVVPSDWCVDTQDPVTTDDSEPEPDVRVVRGEFVDRHPRPKDTGMLVEVSDTSLRRDRSVQKRIYARAAIPYYWIVNLIDNHIEVYSDPTGPAEKPDYRQRQLYGANDEVPVILDGKEVGRIAVRDLLP
jgi:hypothetical protein